MPMIYRRSRAPSPRPGPSRDGALSPPDASDDKDADFSLAGRVRRWGRRAVRARCRRLMRSPRDASPAAEAMASPSAAARATHRVSRTLWLAVLVYAFWGLPVLGRLLAAVRYAHRFPAPALVAALAAGALQDLAVFLQASTLLCFVKLLLDPFPALGVNYFVNYGGQDAAGTTGAGWLAPPPERLARPTAFPNSGFLRAPPPGSLRRYYMRLPAVYLPVLPTEYDPVDSALGSSKNTNHLTLVAAGGPLAAGGLGGSGSGGSGVGPALARAARKLVVAALLLAIVALSTVTSVADFCLQVALHPRLDRARVQLVLTYFSQFVAALVESSSPSALELGAADGDDDDGALPRAVVFSWSVYAALVVALTYGFFTGRLPLLPDVLHLPARFAAWCCCSCFCGGALARKNSSDTFASSSASPASPAPVLARVGAFLVWCWNCLWLTNGRTRSRRRSGYNFPGAGYPSSQLGAASSLPSYASSAAASSSSVAYAFPGSISSLEKLGPVVTIWRCVLVSIMTSCAALSFSLALANKCGVDMKLMSNAMFALQTENLFANGPAVVRHDVNCTLAAETLQAALSRSETFNVSDLGNDDHCALLWRRTTGYTGDSVFELDLSKLRNQTVSVEDTNPASMNATVDAVSESAPTPAAPSPVTQPNIILINMESWRHLDVGVLGAAEKKARFNGRSATPMFDELSQSGVLFTNHYTPCVQTSRSILTTLFGMQPSCTEAPALKRATSSGTGLTVHGLPQFLKERGYFNMFWSAVDLARDHKDKFLQQNGFDKLVDDRKVRKMLHEVREYKSQDDDHFSWGIHDHLSFEMLLYAIEEAQNASVAIAQAAASTDMNSTTDVEDMLPEEWDGEGERANADGAAGLTNSSAVFLVNGTEAEVVVLNVSAVKGRHYHPQGEGNDTLEVPTNVSSLLLNDTVAAANGTVLEVPELSTPVSTPLEDWSGLRAPYFIDMYTISSHNPWPLPHSYEKPNLSGITTRFNRKYLEAVHFSDAQLGKFISELRASGLMNNTIVIIEGDHGYGRLEHGSNPSAVDSGVWDEAARVPFLLLADDFLRAEDRGKRVDQVTSQMDVMATIADILGVSPEEPLLQHGVGQSMMRKRLEEELDGSAALEDEGGTWWSPKKKAEENDAVANDLDDVRATLQTEERSVVLCNPFNGGTKGVRTDSLKYVFFPDRSFNVFDVARDPMERSPVRRGFDIDDMDADVRARYDFVNEQVDLHQFLFHANKFMTPLPTPAAVPNASNETVTSAKVVPRDPRPKPALRGDNQAEEPAVAATLEAQQVNTTTADAASEPKAESAPSPQRR